MRARVFESVAAVVLVLGGAPLAFVTVLATLAVADDRRCSPSSPSFAGSLALSAALLAVYLALAWAGMRWHRATLGDARHWGRCALSLLPPVAVAAAGLSLAALCVLSMLC